MVGWTKIALKMGLGEGSSQGVGLPLLESIISLDPEMLLEKNMQGLFFYLGYLGSTTPPSSESKRDYQDYLAGP